MKYLTDVTRQDIFDIIKSGFYVKYDEPIKDWDSGIYIDGHNVYMLYHVRISEIEFLERLYDLESMESRDSRFKNAAGDIWQHTVNNDDWGENWVLGDIRFKLTKHNEDEPLLKFICEMFHPSVRDDKYENTWKEYLKKFNEILRADGYEIYEKDHISGRVIYGFRRLDFIELDSSQSQEFAELKLIGEGSYAKVFKYYDARYDSMFALKRAKDGLEEKEIKRFILEFNDMKQMNSPYVIKVYSINIERKQYIMELVDCSLVEYISKNNNRLDFCDRKKLILQLFDAFKYIHSKGMYHRDICPKNILIKKYEDKTIVKISDFGLVKDENSNLTSDLSDIKGYCNDPSLKIEGFVNYNILHEIYALTQVVVYIWTGKSNLASIKDVNVREFIEKGMNSDKTKRYQSLEEMKTDFLNKIR